MTRVAQVFIMRSDKNGDGRLGRSELRGAAARFDQMDKNANGFLEPGERNGWNDYLLAFISSTRRSRAVYLGPASTLGRFP